MKKIVFYSWQSDLPNPMNRGFIGEALEKVAKAIGDDDSVEIEPVIDRDTSGVGGSPDISATIFDKIKKADVFVADVSIINKGSESREMPNPNVLIELGYALRELGHSKIILVMNTEFGAIDLLPFDLKTKRVLTYAYSEGGEKKVQIGILSSKLKSQLETIFENEEPDKDEVQNIIHLIEGQKPERILGTKVFMRSLFSRIESFYPGDGMSEAGEADPEYDQKIIESLELTQDFIAPFRNLVETIALHKDKDSLKALFQGFRPLLEKFDKERDDKGGKFHRAKYDYYRFLGNELFVILVSILLRDERWELLSFVLKESIIINNFGGHKTEAVDFTYFSEHVIHFFLFRKQRLKSDRADLGYDLLIKRRELETEYLPQAVEEYSAADLLLFLKGESSNINSTNTLLNWFPRSLLAFELPEFILLAREKGYAENLVKALGVQNIQDIQVLLKNKVPALKNHYPNTWWSNPISETDIEQIGSR